MRVSEIDQYPSTQNGYAVARNPVANRVWRALGFRMPIAPVIEKKPGFVEGWMVTENHIKFGFGDRVRLLFTGHVKLVISHATDVMPARIESRSAVGVMAPGWE